MPTVEDLKDVLTAREIHVGEAARVEHAVLDRRHRRRGVAPALATAAVIVLAVVSALIATGRSPAPNHVPAAGVTGSAQRPAHEPAVPAHALRWSFGFAGVPGFSFRYEDYAPEHGQENAAVLSTSDPSITASIAVYSPDAFDPASGNVDGTPLRGRRVFVNGHPGTFVAGPSTPTLFWSYSTGHWASVGVEDGEDLDGSTTADVKHAQALALKFACAVRFGYEAPVTLPFRVRSLPTGLTISEINPSDGRPTVTYSTHGGARLSITRVPAPGTESVAAARHAQIAQGHLVTRPSPDGGLLAVIADPLNSFSASSQRQILDAVDLSPDLRDPSTWLAVLPPG